MKFSSSAAVLVAALSLAGAAACSSTGEGTTTPAPAVTIEATTAAADPTTAATTEAATTEAAASGTAGHSVEVDGRTVANVAPNLEFPAGAKVSNTFVNGSGATVILTEPAPADVIAYYREAAPKAGYTVLTDAAGSLLTVEGHGWTAEIITQSKDTTLNFQPKQA